MAIEFITPDMVTINGRAIEIRDSRTPDIFDEIADRENAAIQAAYAGPIRDMEVDLRRGMLPLFQFDPEFSAYQQIPRFIDLARQAAIECGVSYRDFKVGASAYALSAQDQRAGYLFGANLTPYKGAPKRCAELEVITKAKERGFDRIIALAVFGPSDFGDVNAVQSPTLHPCHQCRNMFETEPMVQDDTLVITGNEKGDIELMFKRDLVDLHSAS